MEGSGVCVSCGASDVDLNEEKKCANCSPAQEATPAPEVATEVAPAEAPAEEGASEGGDMPSSEM